MKPKKKKKMKKAKAGKGKGKRSVAKVRKSSQATVSDNGPKRAPKDGPNLTLRMYNASQLAKVQAAARKSGMSTNTFAHSELEKAADLALAKLAE
jgi:hypothetical protein